MKLQDYERAHAAYLRAIELDVVDAYIYHDLGIISEQTDKLKQAEAYFNRALSTDPSHADSYQKLGVVTAALGYPDQSAGYYQQAIRQDPTHAAAHYNLAQHYFAQGRSAEGSEMMEVFAGLKEYEGRLAALKRVVSRNPRNPQASYELAQLHLQYGKVGEAVAVLQRILQIDPSFQLAQRSLEEIERLSRR